MLLAHTIISQEFHDIATTYLKHLNIDNMNGESSNDDDNISSNNNSDVSIEG